MSTLVRSAKTSLAAFLSLVLAAPVSALNTSAARPAFQVNTAPAVPIAQVSVSFPSMGSLTVLPGQSEGLQGLTILHPEFGLVRFNADQPAAAPASAGMAALERHPVMGILNELQRSGVALPESMDGPAAQAQLEAAAARLPEGQAKQDLLAFAQVMAAPRAGRDAGIGKAFDNSAARAELMPAVEAPKAEGFWAWAARSRLTRWTGLSGFAAARAEAGRAKAKPVDVAKLRVPVEKLRWVPDAASLPGSTREIEGGDGQIVGQDRALKDLEFGLTMPGDRYNVTVTGPDGSGRETAVRYLLDRIAPTLGTPGDLVAVTNFSDREHPLVLELPAGKGEDFARGVKRFTAVLARVLPQALNSGELAEAKKAMHEEFDKGMEADQKEAAEALAAIKAGPSGRFGLKLSIQQTGEGSYALGAALTVDGEVVAPGALDKVLAEKGIDKSELNAAASDMETKAQPILAKLKENAQARGQEHRDIHEKMEALDKQAVAAVASQLGGDLLKAVSSPKGAGHDDSGHQAWRERMSARQEELDARHGSRAVGPLHLRIHLMQMGGNAMPLPMLFKSAEAGEPLEPEQLQAMKESGELTEEQLRGVQEQVQAAVREYVAAFREMTALNRAEHAALHKDDVPPTPAEERALAYVQALLTHAVENYQAFVGPEVEGPLGQGAQRTKGSPSDLYRVSVLASNKPGAGAPVIYERTPSYENLFGTMEDKKQVMMVPGAGMVRMDDPGGPVLKSGSFIKANGGFLVLNLMDVLREPAVWAALMRAVRDGKAEISEGGVVSVLFNGGEKHAVPAKVKIVFLGLPWLAEMLEHYDSDYKNNFKAKAEMESALEIGADTILGYLRFTKKMVGLSTGEVLDLARGAIAGILEYAARMAESNEKLSARFGSVLDVLREASYWARQAGRPEVERADVDAALEHRRQREGMMRRHMQELYWKDIFHIQTEGSAVGQLNALTVYGGADAFGMPTRVSVTVNPSGTPGVTSIERNAELAGPFFKKGLDTLRAFLMSTFGKDAGAFPAEVIVAKEQSYSMIDGDSSTSTNGYASLSALSGVPLRQGIAITGSMDQFGNVQAIGGVNHKIEGYFDVLTHKLAQEGRALDGTHGIIIPRTNVSQLALRPDVVQAVREGKFVIYAVDHIGQGIEILSGQAYAEVLRAAGRNLEKMRKAKLRAGRG